MRILFLTAYMMPGYGTSVVVAELVRRLEALGHFAAVGCLRSEREFEHPSLFETIPEAHSVLRLAQSMRCSVIVAHTSPFFEVLPALRGKIDCWAFEHGDPTPELFDTEQEERRRIVHYKQENVYPHVCGVITVSHFLRYDIQYPQAHVIHNGCDHMPYKSSKPSSVFTARRGHQLHVGALARLGDGEQRYKGFDEFINLKTRIDKAGIAARFHVMGRGAEPDAARLRAQGIEVSLNGSEEAKLAYLRRLDVFISPSLWEGFDLPLVEAASQGTVALAFDTGAHPEVTPLVVANRDDLFGLISAYARDRQLLATHSRLCHNYVWKKFRWEHTARMLLAVLENNGPTQPAPHGGRG